MMITSAAEASGVRPGRMRRSPGRTRPSAPSTSATPRNLKNQPGSATGPAEMTYALWIVQGLLAALFLFVGGAKLVLPLERMTGPGALPCGFLRWLGVAAVLGALGLVL